MTHKPTAVALVLRHESTSDASERTKIRREILVRMKRDPEMRRAFNWLERVQ